MVGKGRVSSSHAWAQPAAFAHPTTCDGSRRVLPATQAGNRWLARALPNVGAAVRVQHVARAPGYSRERDSIFGNARPIAISHWTSRTA
jgi:hypothetical protein